MCGLGVGEAVWFGGVWFGGLWFGGVVLVRGLAFCWVFEGGAGLGGGFGGVWVLEFWGIGGWGRVGGLRD